ncbi:MAG: uroporphyrinogen decarboxylase [Clostridiales bacterium]|nr:uroporphyrinogen decarboxylase [Clostridiales bacterium]
MATQRERVKRAILNRDAADIVPWQINYTLPYLDMYKKSHLCENLDDEFQNHINLVKYKRNTAIDVNTEVDLFGLKWDKSGEDGGDIGLPIEPPLASGNIDDYRFPEVNKEFATEQAMKLENDGSGRFRMYGLTFTLYERAWGLRGMESLLCDMLLEPEFVHELMRRIVEHHMKFLDLVLPYDFDAIYFGDDWGSQKGLVMGAELWRKMIKPYMKQLCRKIKDSGKLVVLHSCGNIGEVLGEFVDMGVDCYNTVQPEVYDLKKLKAEYGKDICFYGGISNQSFLPHAMPDEVYAKCLEVLDIMAGGGYILSPTHNLTPDIPIENAYAILRAAKKFSGLE